MRHDLDTALDRCLTLLRSGEDIESCLRRYPEYSRQLRPLLEMAVQVGRVVSPVPSEVARADGEQRMLSALAQKRARDAAANPVLRTLRRSIRSLGSSGGRGLRPAWTVAGLVLMALLLAAGAIGVVATTQSLPGDELYAVKQVGHRVQISLTFGVQERQQLEERFQAQQRSDVQRALEAGRQGPVEFQGVVESLAGTRWVVGGVPVALTDETTLAGQPILGATAQVRGVLSGGDSVRAIEIRTDPASIPEPTQTPQPTASPEPTETPTSTETPEPTNTPMPSPTPTFTNTPEPSPTPQPAYTATVDSAVEPVQMPDPTREPRPTRTPEPTQSMEQPTPAPTPTQTPPPTDTHDPTDTPQPTETHHPTDTPHPTEEDHPTDTPHPTNTPHPTRTEEPDDD
jgi:hypothetical protein